MDVAVVALFFVLSISILDALSLFLGGAAAEDNLDLDINDD